MRESIGHACIFIVHDGIPGGTQRTCTTKTWGLGGAGEGGGGVHVEFGERARPLYREKKPLFDANAFPQGNLGPEKKVHYEIL